MIISTIAYQRFYEVLIDQFASKEISESERNILGRRSYLIWDVKNSKTEESIFLDIFRHHTSDTRYFYKKLGQFDPSKTRVGYLKDGLMIEAFEYIGLSLPPEIKAPGLLPIKLKAQILYQLFLEKYFPEFWDKNIAELKVYDRELNEVRDKSEETNKYTNADTSIPMAENPLIACSDEEAITALISRFYDMISQSRLEEAWNLLAPNFQKRVWKDKFESFSLGYTNTITIHDVHVFQMVKKASDINCKVYYEDDVVTYTSLELGNISKITVSKLDAFNERINTLRSTASTIGLSDFEKIELQKLFEPAVSEYIWYKCGMNPDLISDLLPSQEIITIPRLYHISCILIDSNWLIKGIHPIKSHLIR